MSAKDLNGHSNGMDESFRHACFVMVRCLLLAGIAALVFPLFLRAGDARVVRVGYYPFDGFLMEDADGRRSGYGYDYLQEVRNYTNWTYDYTKPGACWADMLPMLREGKIDLLPGVSRTPDREREFAFSEYPLVKTSTLMTVRAGNTRYRTGDYKNWTGIRVGMLKNSTQSARFAEHAKEKGFTYETVWFDGVKELLSALQAGKDIDAAVTSSLRKINEWEWVFEQFSVSEMYIAVRKDDTALLEELNRTMEHLEAQFPELQEELRRTYYTHKESGILPFSGAELDYVKSSGELMCLMNPDRKPFSWLENGEYHGIFKEYADEICKRTGLKFRFLPVSTRGEYYAARASGKADLVLDMAHDRQTAEQTGFRLSQPYFTASVSMLRDKNAGNATRSVTILAPGSLGKRARALHGDDVKIRIAKSMAELIADVKSTHSDAGYLLTRSAEYAVYDDEHNQLVANYIQSLDNPFSIGVNNSQDPRLLSVINKAVLSLDNTYADGLRRKYAAKFQDVFSLGRFFHRHPLTAVGVPVAVLLFLCAFLGYVLSRRRKLYQTGVLFSKLPFRCFVMDAHGKFLFCTLGQRSGLLDEPNLRGIEDIPDETVRNIMRGELAEVLKTGKQGSAELLFDGQARSAIVLKLPDSAFGPDTVIWISQDISELQASREETRRHEEFFRLTLQSIGDGAITTDAKGNVLTLNPVAERLTGVTNSKAQGKPHGEVFRIVNAKDGKPMPSSLRKALEIGKIVEMRQHTDLLSSTGKRYHVADCAGPIRNEAGSIVGAVLIFRDVTQEYSRREALRESVSNWETASKLAKLYPYRVNVRTREVSGNPERLKPFWPIKNGFAAFLTEWIVPEDRDAVREEYEAVKAGRSEQFVVTYRAGLPGEERYYRWFGRMDATEPDILTGLIQDITEIKEAELERESAMSLWEQAVNAAPILMFIKSEADDFRYVQCNRNFGDFVGLTPEKVIGRTDAELFNRPQDANAFRAWDRKIMEGGKPVEFFESALGANGTMYHFQTVKMPFRDVNGKLRLIGMSTNITEVTEQRERLKNTNAQLEIGSRLNRSVMFHLNVRTGEISATDMLREIWPMRDGKILSPEEWILPEDLPAVEWWLNALQNETSGTRHQVEYRTDIFGVRRYYRTSVQPSRDAAGDLWLTGATQDVTELMEAAAKLRDSSMLWKNVMDELPVLFFAKDAGNGGRYVMCNKANAEFLGFPPDKVIGKTTRELGRVGPAYDAVLASEEILLSGDAIERTRVNVPDARGVMREMEKIEMAMTIRNGRKLLVGIAFDITEREQNLRLAMISSRILAGIASEPDFGKCLDLVGKTVIDILGCLRVIFADAGDDGLLHFRSECDNDSGKRFSDGPVALHEKIWNSYLDTMQKDEILCFERLGAEERLHSLCRDYPEYLDAGLAAVPVVLHGKLFGIMIVTFPHPRAFTKIERRMLRTVADCLVIAVSRAEQANALSLTRREQERQETNRNTINECLNVFIKSDYMNVPFERLLEIIRKHLGASHCVALRIDRETALETCLAESVEHGKEKFLQNLPPIPFDPASFWFTELTEKEVVPWKDLRSDDVRSRLSAPWRKATDTCGIRSVWDAALKPGDEFWGSLEIVYDEESHKNFSEQDESFVRSAAHLVSMILMRSLNRDNLIRTRDRLTAALKQAQSAEKAKSYFLASMSHEIRTPLNAVIGFTEMMREAPMDAEVRKECLDNIYTSGNALLQLINDILDLSKLEADEMPIVPVSTDFPSFCTELCRSFQYAADRKNLKLIVHLSESMPLLMLDKLRIRQILFNLVGNAIKFTKTGSVQVSGVFTPSSSLEGSLLLQVADTGVGIPEADRKKLFEPFVQLSKMRGTNSSNSGTGLGLVIVRKLADRMGGVLSLDSEEGKGSTFSILLSNVKIAGDAPSAEPDSVSAPSVPEIADSSCANKLRVLVADDSAMNLKIMLSMLKRMRAETDCAENSGDIMEKLAKDRFDWVLASWNLPGMNGAKLAKEIHANPAYRAVRVALVRTEHDVVPESNLYDAVLTRPVGPRQLRECLFRRKDIE